MPMPGEQQEARAPLQLCPEPDTTTQPPTQAGALPILVIHLELSKRDAGFQAELGEGEGSSFH